MSDVAPPLVLSSVAPAPRRLTLATTAGIALATFVVGLMFAAWAIGYFRAAPQPAPALQTAAAPPAKIIVASPVATDPASLSARQEILSAQLVALEQRSAAITSTAANAYGNASRAEALLVVLISRRAIDRGLELGYIEQQLRDRFGAIQPAEVATIIDASHHPVTPEDLRLGLDQIGPQLALGPAGDGGWGGAVWRLFGSLIVIHPKNTPSPVPSERLARVRRMLAQGQVEAAVEEVNRLPGAAQATGWMTGARQYIAARKALIVLETVAIQGRATTPTVPGVSPIR